MARPQAPSGIAGFRVLDLDHLGAEPGERLGAGRPRLELREIDNANAFEAIQLDASSIHRSHSSLGQRPHYSSCFAFEGTVEGSG